MKGQTDICLRAEHTQALITHSTERSFVQNRERPIATPFAVSLTACQ